MRLCKGLAVCWRFGFSGAPREARALDVPRKELKTEVACLLFRQKCTRFSDTGERLIGRLMRATLRGTCRQHGGRQDHELIGCRHEQQPTHVGTNIEIGIGDVVLGLQRGQHIAASDAVAIGGRHLIGAVEAAVLGRCHQSHLDVRQVGATQWEGALPRARLTEGFVGEDRKGILPA